MLQEQQSAAASLSQWWRFKRLKFSLWYYIFINPVEEMMYINVRAAYSTLKIKGWDRRKKLFTNQARKLLAQIMKIFR